MNPATALTPDLDPDREPARAGRDDEDLAPAPETAAGHRDALSIGVRIAVTGALVLVVARFYVPRLVQGLSTDEFLSAWVSADGPVTAVGRANRFQGNSPLYFVALWCWRSVAGASELVLRIPSTLCVVLAAVLLVRFVRRNSATAGIGSAVVVVFAGRALVMAQATSARPYAPLLLLAAGATVALWRWLEDGRRRDGVAWMLCLVAGVAMTPFAAALGVAHLAAVADARRLRPTPPGLAPLLALGAALSLPLVPQVLDLAGRRDELVISRNPGAVELLTEILPATALAALGALLLLAGPSNRSPVDARALRFAAMSSALPPLLLAAVGALGETPVWAGRYYIVAVPGSVLLVALVWSALPRHAAPAGLAVLLAIGAHDLAGAAPSDQGWREAFAWTAAETASDDDVVVALTANLVETHQADLLDDPEWYPYLISPALYYEVAPPVVGLPRESPTMRSYVDRRLPELLTYDTIVIIDGRPLPDWFEILGPELAAAGYRESAAATRHRLRVEVWRREVPMLTAGEGEP